MFYTAGRFLQLVGLLTLPTSMWVAHFEKDETRSISIAVVSIVIFFAGHLMAQSGKK